MCCAHRLTHGFTQGPYAHFGSIDSARHPVAAKAQRGAGGSFDCAAIPAAISSKAS